MVATAAVGITAYAKGESIPSALGDIFDFVQDPANVSAVGAAAGSAAGAIGAIGSGSIGTGAVIGGVAGATGPLGWILLGHDDDSLTWNCWKPIIHHDGPEDGG